MDGTNTDQILQSSNLHALIDLVHHRWNIPVLAALKRASGSKFVTLANSLGVSRASLSASISDLIALGLIEKNSGHGHPMRPEYRLTTSGDELAHHCVALDDAIRRRNVADLAYRKWTLPIIAAIGDEVLRFNQLKRILSDATPRAITLALKALVSERYADRTIIDDYPPTAGYHLRAPGQRILKCMDTMI